MPSSAGVAKTAMRAIASRPAARSHPRLVRSQSATTANTTVWRDATASVQQAAHARSQPVRQRPRASRASAANESPASRNACAATIASSYTYGCPSMNGSGLPKATTAVPSAAGSSGREGSLHASRASNELAASVSSRLKASMGARSGTPRTPLSASKAARKSAGAGPQYE
jgi:hypothetical protein